GGLRSRRGPYPREAALAGLAPRARACRGDRARRRQGARVSHTDRATQARAGWMFVLPALGLIGIFFVVPVIGGLLLSFTDFDIYAIGDPTAVRLVGLQNYARILTDREFWGALRNTLVFVLAGGPLSVLVSLGAALLVNAKLVRWKSVFRVILFS